MSSGDFYLSKHLNFLSQYRIITNESKGILGSGPRKSHKLAVCIYLRIVIRQKYCRRVMRRLFSVSRPFSVGKLWLYNRDIPKGHKVIPIYDFSTSRPSFFDGFFVFNKQKRECYENQNFYFMCHTVGWWRCIRKMRTLELHFNVLFVKRWRSVCRWWLLCLLRSRQHNLNNSLFWHLYNRHVFDVFRHQRQRLLQTI